MEEAGGRRREREEEEEEEEEEEKGEVNTHTPSTQHGYCPLGLEAKEDYTTLLNHSLKQL